MTRPVKKATLFKDHGNPRSWKIVFLGLAMFLNLSALAQVYGQVTDPIFGRKETFGIGPRAIGMGSAFTALADDASAVYWNPAGLSQLSSYELEVSGSPVNFDSHFGFPYYSSIQFIMPIAKENTLGISFFRPFNPQRDYFSGTDFDSATRAENSYLLNPSFQESEIILSYAARFATLQNFAVGVNIKRITNDPYYIKYFPNSNDSNEAAVQQSLQNATRVIGYGVDIGFLYRIPITKYSEEFRLGLSLRDLVSRVEYVNGLQVTTVNQSGQTIVNYNVGPGFETEIPPEITLGLALTNHYFFRVRNVMTLDYDQISDPRFDGSDNTFIRFGTEFWFFNDVLGVRGGYSTPISRPGTISLGLSFRSLGGDFQADLAYLLPVSPTADVASGSAIGVYNTGGINFEPFYIGLDYAFGGGQEIPPPQVSAFVRPASFTPAEGEKATFFLDTTEDVTVKKWSVLIYDSNNHYVRGMRGVGSPPTQLVWGGEDDSYQPLLPGVYTWAFQVQDELGHIGSTPIQTVEILGAQPALTRDPSRLLAIRQQQAALLAQERQALSALAQKNLQDLLGEVTPTPGTAVGVEPQANTQTPEAGGVPVIGFTSIPPDDVLNAHFDKNANGDPIVVVSYQSKLDYVPYIYQEASDVIKATVNSVGTGLKDIQTRVYYGKNELSINTPSEAAANYASGKINQMQLMQLSDIVINGQKVGPNGY
jgi:hypothetical protein